MKNEELIEIINDFLSKRPECLVAIGYGSHVVKQKNNEDMRNNQVDLLLGVDNIKSWNNENIISNPSDYSENEKRVFSRVSKNFLDFYTGISFLTFIDYKDYKFKLGIFDINKVEEDLLKGKSYYLVGRLSKPNLVIKSSDEFREALRKNRDMALWTGACLLGSHGSIRDLYVNIAGFSYLGDIRNGINLFGKELFRRENPQKVANLVDGNYNGYDKIYHHETPFLEFYDDVVLIDTDKLLEYAKQYIPDNMYNYLEKSIIQGDYEKTRSLLIKYLKSKNFESSLIQALKGLVMVDMSKTKKYLKLKALKAKN